MYYTCITVTTTSMKITNLSWQTKTLPIKNKTVRTLSNGIVIPTAQAMYRQIAKI